ncbi:MAG: dienelactone hydrolase family protein [Nocardioidaceae bacterium]|nr:dienelactone hydrolase family protein [Nocardioidaceae bacterium]
MLTLTDTITIDVPGSSSMTGYRARPADRRPRGAVIVAMELFGVSAHVRDACERLAGSGLLAVAPDLYHRSSPGTELAADAAGRETGFALLEQLGPDEAVADVAATMVHLVAEEVPLLGVLGLSVGGHVAYRAATRLPLPAVAMAYPGWLAGIDIALGRPTPTLAATPGVTARMLLLFGAEDALVPADERAEIGAALTEAGVAHEIVTYDGLGHAFLCDRRTGYDRAGAEDAWERILGFLDVPQDPPGD